MNYKTHMVLSTIATMGLLMFLRYRGYEISFLTGAICGLAAIIYSILPDIDTQASKIRELTTIALLLAGVAFFFAGGTYLMLICLISLLMIWLIPWKHRGWTHTFTFALCISAPLLYFGMLPFIVALLSYQVHLLFDKRIMEKLVGGKKKNG